MFHAESHFELILVVDSLVLSFQKYVCDKCGKQFTDKSNLIRHMKTHVQSSKTYPCDVCGNEFKRADHRKRHEESHNYTITCPVCGQYFNRRESMLRHRALHERPEVMKRDPSPGPSNNPPKQPRSHSPQSSNSPSVEPNILPEDPETRVLYLRHWNTIRTEEATGNRVQDRYHFTLHDMTASTFPEKVRRIFRQQTTAFKINLSFGFILRNVETGELRCYHSSQNNSRFLLCSTPHQNRRLGEVSRGVEPI
jgi:DNA-directed RNA polymerase subunit RPC12/RpoP